MAASHSQPCLHYEEEAECSKRQNSLCFRDEFVSVIPVSQEIRCLFIIHSDVMILKDSGEEVVYLSSDIQDVPHPVKKPKEGRAYIFFSQAKMSSQHHICHVQYLNSISPYVWLHNLISDSILEIAHISVSTKINLRPTT